MLNGTKVKLGIFAPTRDQAISRPVTRTIARDKIEFKNTEAYDITRDDSVVPASIDLRGARIEARILADEDGAFADVSGRKAFNGFTLTFAALTDNSHARIVNARVLGEDETGLAAAKLSFTASKLSINLDGLPFGAGDTVAVQLGFRLSGGKGADAISGFEGRDRLLGHSGDDVLRGNKGNDLVSGGNGDDRLEGGSGHDTLRGGAGNDNLRGGPGDDQLVGGAGSDWLDGGSGEDRFIFNRIADSAPGAANRDRIVDFAQGEDRVDLAHIDAKEDIRGDQHFRWLGERAFGEHAGELRFEHRHGDTFVLGDVDGDGNADLVIQLMDQIGLKAGDFLL